MDVDSSPECQIQNQKQGSILNARIDIFECDAVSSGKQYQPNSPLYFYN